MGERERERKRDREREKEIKRETTQNQDTKDLSHDRSSSSPDNVEKKYRGGDVVRQHPPTPTPSVHFPLHNEEHCSGWVARAARPSVWRDCQCEGKAR